ncbi:MAG: lamin tail domain-containing protein [Cyclobacteriaceae bacterium]
MIRTIFVLVFALGLSGYFPLHGQLTDDFSDGDFTANPAWGGANNQGVSDATALWEIVEADFQLQPIGQSGESGQRISYLSTPYTSTLALDTKDHTWSFRMKVDFTGVSSGVWNGNHARVYLFSDEADLGGDLNGYFVRLREETIELFRQTGSTTTKINLNGTEQSLTPQSFVDVEVRRTTAGDWEVLVESATQGTANDNTHTTADHFGVQIRYTAASRDDKFAFDDFQLTSVTGSGPTLGLTSLTQAGANSMELTFNQEVTAASAELESNYTLSGIGSPTSALLNSTDATKVTLNFTNLSNLNYQLTVDGVDNADETSSADNLTINIKMNQAISSRAIVINEILADPENGLQETEYLELLSRSNEPIELEGFELEGYGNTLGSFVLNPGAYVVISASAEDFSVPALDISSGALTNGGEQLTLKDASGNIVDQVVYSDDWYTADFEGNGYSLERINPNQECSGSSNWGSSTNATGGTPGAQNSIFGTSTDTTPPMLLSFEVADEDSVVLTFSEEVSQAAIDAASIAIAPNITIDSETVEDGLSSTVKLDLRDELISEHSYMLSIANLEDCAGNNAASIDTTFFYDVTPPLLIGYFLKSTNQVDLIFSEKLNTSSVAEKDFLLDDNVEPEDESADSTRVSLFFEQDFIEGETYEVSVTGIEDLYDNEIEESQSISFTYKDELDTIRVVAPNAIELSFARDVDMVSAAEVANYLLEEEIAPMLAARVEGMNNQIRLFFEENFRENRELELSVENLTDIDQNTLFTPNYIFIYDTGAPEVESVEVLDEHSLRLIFDERLEPVAAEITNNYQLNDEVFATASELQIDQTSVIIDFNVDFPLEQEQELSIDNLSDLLGNQMTRAENVTFVYDTLGPRVDSVKLLSERLVELVFSEPVNALSSTEITNYTWGTSTQPILADRKTYDSTIVHLSFATPLTKGTMETLRIQSIIDVRGNVMEAPISLSLNSLNPYLSSYRFENDTTLALGFSTNVVTDSLDIILEQRNFELGAVIDNEITLELSEPIQDDNTAVLAVIKVLSSQGDTNLEPQQLTIVFDSQFDSYLVREKQVVDLHFELELGQVSAGQFISTKPLVNVTQDADDPNIIRLFLVSPLSEGDMLEVQWQGLEDTFGRSLPDFAIAIPYDQTPPEVASFETLLTNQILVKYTEAVDVNTAKALNHYTLNGELNSAEVTLSGDSTVLLDFQQPFIGDSSYQLSIKNVRDLSSNTIADTTLSFQYIAPYVPIIGDLIITEIMADPSPVVGLPEYEYIEIQNTSNQAINLFQVTLSDNLTSQNLPNIELEAGSYAILTDDSRVSSFQGFGTVIPVGTFPSLGNSGDSLVLSVEGTVIDQVQYSSSWYRDSNKNDGGYALEKIGVENGCDVSTDWAASLSLQGGTPGQPNSLMVNFIDSIPPELVATELIEDVIHLEYSEALDPTSVVEDKFTFPIEIADVTIGETANKVLLTLGQPFPVGNELNLVVSGLQDCLGNISEETTVAIGVGRAPGFNEIIITELMADPEPAKGLPIAEYLEIYNPTDVLITTADIVLSDGTSETTLPTFNIEPQSYVILTPTSSVDDFEPYGEVRGVTSWPSLNNGGERISLNLNTELIFSVEYQDDWYNSVEASEGGISLEMVDPANPCAEENNWTASEASLGGTPGQVNSVNQPNPDNTGPKLTQAIAIETNGTLLIFDEQLSDNTALWGFEINPNVGIIGADLLESRKQISLVLSDELALNQPYTIEVAGMADCLGNVIGEENTQTFVLPEAAAPGDIVINEVLFNPRTGGVDFVEVYNVSEKYINFKFWFTSNDPLNEELVPLSVANNILPPNDIAVFTTLPDVLHDQYPQGDHSRVFLAPLPTMPNDEGRIAFISADTILIDAFDYNEDFHSNLLNDVDGVSLERVSVDAPTGNESNWQSASSAVGFATPGKPNSQARMPGAPATTIQIEPKVFIPGTNNSFTTISYQDDQAGSFASVIVYDVEGRVVKQLAQNELLAANGFFTWDGTNENGNKARTGIYVVYFELYNASGEVEIIKETVVVGASF